MGCLFEIFIEIFIEGILNLVMFVYLKVAHVLVPNKDISPKAENRIRNIMENTFKLSVPLKVEMEVGNDWYEAK
mgnify:CR=1 FL=1